MLTRIFTIFLITVFAVPLFAQAKADVVVMQNGDRITCEIKGLEGGILMVKLDYVDGTVSIQWSKVAKIESDHLFIVKTNDGMVLEGQLSTAASKPDEPLRIEVSPKSTDKVELESQDVVTIRTSSEKFWKRFNGDISIGMSYSKGNRSTQYNLSSSIEYPRERWNAIARFNSNLSSNSNSSATTRNQFDMRVNRLMKWDNFFSTATVNVLESSEQGIGIQTTLSGGVGFLVRDSNHSKVSVLGGLGWQRTNYTGSGQGRNTQNMLGAILNTQVKVFKFKKTGLNIDATLLPSLSEPGRVYFKINQEYYVKLFSNLSWNFSFYGNWDSRPPLGLSASDYGTSTGLGWSFGNK